MLNSAKMAEMLNSTQEKEYFALLKQIELQCDSPKYPAEQVTKAIGYICYNLIGMLANLAVFPATLRLAKKYTAFNILLNIILIHILMQAERLSIYIEYFLNYRVHFLWDLDAYYYTTTTGIIATAYLLLAVNRTLAIFAAIQYKRIFSAIRSKILLAICWLLCLARAIYFNYKPTLRVYHCMSTLDIQSPYGKTSVQAFDPEAGVIWSMSRTFVAVHSIAPIVLYVACLLKIAVGLLPCANPSATASNGQLDGAMRERIRLYFICFLGTLPYFAMYIVRTYTDYDNSDLSKMLYTIFYLQFQCQQPFLMVLLSKDMRKEMRKNCGCLFPENTTNNRTKVAWTRTSKTTTNINGTTTGHIGRNHHVLPVTNIENAAQ